MSTSPVTLMVARRVADGRYQDLIAWLREGEQLATDFPGYLGSGVLAPPPNDDEFQIIFRFADEKTLHAWEHSASRTAWLARGNGLFQQPSEHRVSGIDGWFGSNAAQRPPRWKQACITFLVILPLTLTVPLCWHPLFTRITWLGGYFLSNLLITLTIVVLVVYLFMPRVTRLFAPWLRAPAKVNM